MSYINKSASSQPSGEELESDSFVVFTAALAGRGRCSCSGSNGNPDDIKEGDGFLGVIGRDNMAKCYFFKYERKKE